MHRSEIWGQRGVGISIGRFFGKNCGTSCPFVVQSVNARMDLKWLEYLILPVVQRINDTIGDAVFQQDNSPVHTESVVTERFEQHNIQVNEHPPYSPDLNPIEHF